MLAMISALLVCGADVGPKPLSYAGQPTPLKDMPGIEVEMAAEDVKLVLHKSRLDVEVVFHMLNHGPDVEFQEGFPIGPFLNMNDFSFTIDGKPVPFERVNRRPQERVALKEADDHWYVWSAAFKAGARHTHVVKYWVDLSHQHFYHQTGYILHTGAAWKNPIGKATVTLKFGDGTSVDHLRGVQPFDSARVQPDQVVWTFENIEPTKAHDIVISYGLETWKEDVAKLRQDASWNGRHALAATLKDLPAWQGRKTFTPAELRDYLDALGGLLSEGAMEDGKFVFPGTDPERVSGPPELTKLFAGQTRMRYYVLEDDILHMFQGFLDEALTAAREHPAEAKATLTLYRDFLRRLANGEVHIDYRKLSGGRNAGKILPARALKPEEKNILEAKLAEANALLK